MTGRGRVCVAIAVALALAGPATGASPGEAPGDAVALTRGEARQLAERAWAAGRVPVANRVARILAEADPDDVPSLLILSASETALGRSGEGRAAGRRAFRAAETAAGRYEAAYLVSAGAMAEDRYIAAQYWLRRAYHAAETEVQRDRIARTFGAVRAASPWHWRVSVDVAPSSNVNGGAESPYLVIEDSPFVGVLSGDAQALSGVQTAISASLGYDLAKGRESRTSLYAHAYRSFVSLSDDAEETAPDAEGADFEYGVAELQLVHRIAEPPGPLPDSYAVALGQTWYGGEPLDRVARLSVSRRVDLGQAWGLRFDLEGEQREPDDGGAERVGTEFGAELRHRLAGGTRLHLGVTVTEVGSLDPNAEYSGRGIEAGFDMGEPVMGLRLGGRLGYRVREYDDYAVGFIAVPGGREDQTWDARLDLHVDRADVMGFVPVISLSAESTESNVSRFEGESTGLSIGFRSAF